MKKILLTCVAIFFVPIAHAAKLFPDVLPDYQYFEAISALETRDIIHGFPDGYFRPDENVSRAASLKIILLSANVEVTGVAIKNPFPDVPKDQWFAAYVKKAQEIGVVKGDGNGNFVPTRNVSRAEALAMLFRTNGTTLDEVRSAPFLDVPTYAWYAKYFAVAKKTGLLSGKKADPNHMLTRAELSDLAYRFFKNDWNTNTEEGLASYYHESLEGNATANGETFSNDKYTAAHRTFPFGTRVRVTNTDTLESVVVRINDRGPYVENRIIDLTKKSFGALSPLSTGVIPVSLQKVSSSTPLGKANNCDVDKSTQVIEKDFYDGIHLFSDIPKQVRKNEVYTLSGIITGDNTPKFVSVFYGTNEKKRLFRGEVHGKTFSIPILFDEAGTFFLSVLPGDSGNALRDTIYVVQPDCEGRKPVKTTAPAGIFTSIQNGFGAVRWETKENNLFRIHFQQGQNEAEFFVYNKNTLLLPPQAFHAFSGGIATMTLWGAKADGGALYRESAWRKSKSQQVYFIDHISRHDNTITDISLTESFSPGQTISFSGTSSEPISSEALIIDPNENIYPEDISLSGNHFSGSFVADIPGVYTLEINKTDGIMLFVGATVPNGTLPVLPDYFDMSLINVETSDTSVSKESKNILLRLTNKERLARGINAVQADENLASLAQFRADDMCKNNYFSHVDLKGKTAADYRVMYGVQTYVAENIVQDSGVVRSHERLMRSAGHRQNIINPTHARVGFGICRSESNPNTLVIVQIFGGEPYSPSALPNIREDILAEVNSVRINDPIVPSSTLESVAQQWANTMAEKNIFSFTDGEDSLEKSLRNAGVNQVASGMVFRIGSLSDIMNAFSQQNIAIGNVSQNNFLLDTDFSKMGIGIAQNASWEIYMVIVGAH